MMIPAILLNMNAFENIFANGFHSIIGSPALMALLLVGFFGAFVMFQGTGWTQKIVIIIPALLLAGAIEPIFAIIGLFIIVLVVFFALSQFALKR